MSRRDLDDAFLRSDLRSLFETRQALVCLRDTQGRFIRVNCALADLYDIDPEEMEGRRLSEFYGIHAARHLESDEAVMRRGVPAMKAVEPLPIRGDRTLWVENCRIPVSDSGGKSVALLVIANDLTATQGLPLSDDRGLLEMVIDSLDSPVAFYDAESRLEFANRAYWEAHDYMGTRDIVRIGTRFEDAANAIFERAVQSDHEADREALFAKFLEDFRNPVADTIIKQKDRWYQHHRYVTPSGGRVTFSYDITKAKKTELELFENRNLLETIVESFSEMLSLYGPDGGLKFGNKTYWKFHEDAGTADVVRIGATIEENAQAMVRRLAERDATFDPEATFRNIVRQREDQTTDVEFLWGKRYVRLRQYPTPDGGLVVFGYDVTERKKAESALEVSNTRLVDFAESASDWFWEMDADLRYTWISERIAEATGEAADLVYGRKRSDLIDKTVDPEAWAAHQEIIRQRKPFKDFVYRREPTSLPEGYTATLWVKTSGVPMFGSDGSFCGYRGTGSNVTKEKLAEQELRDSERRYQTLAETAPVGIFRTSLDGVCTFCNEIWCAIIGYDRSTDPGAHWTSVFAKDDRQRIAASWREIALREDVYRTEARIGGGDGNDSWVLATIALEKDDDGRPCAFIGTVTDISRLKRVEAELRVAQDALREHRDELETLVDRRTAALQEAQRSLLAKERLSAIGQLTATVSHELRTPLGTIGASFAALRQRVEFPNEKALSIAARIDRNIARCETIIRDLLNFTRIDSLNREPLHLDSWTMKTLGELEISSGISLEISLRSGSKVNIDRTRMAQALTNLISNATDAMEGDAASGGMLEIESEQKDRECQIKIRDDGPGIPPDDLERVFEPLVSSKAFGVGLGLPLVRRIVEFHGGSVVIKNRDKRGCEAIISLPLHKDRGPVAVCEDSAGGES